MQRAPLMFYEHIRYSRYFREEHWKGKLKLYVELTRFNNGKIVKVWYIKIISFTAKLWASRNPPVFIPRY